MNRLLIALLGWLSIFAGHKMRGQNCPVLRNIPQVTCLHTENGLDSLQFPGKHEKFDTLYIYIDSLIRTGKGRINILHIGGSHVQGGMFTHRMRVNMDSLGGLRPAGRGMLFPYRAIKTNAPADYVLSSGGIWRGVRNVQRDSTTALGLSGACAITDDTTAWLGLNIGKIGSRPLKRLRILGQGTTPDVRPYLICSGDTIQSLPADSLPGLCFPLPPEADSVTVRFEGLWPDSISYELRGLWPEGDEDGFTYTASGINGANLPSWLKCGMLEEELTLAPPQLVIMGVGINDANVPPAAFDPEKFKENYRELMRRIRRVSPDCCFLFITNNDCWLNVRGYRRRPNMNTKRVWHAMNELAAESGSAVFDCYRLMGGQASSNAWVRAGLQRRDHIHFSRQGYELWGDLLYNALMKPLVHSDSAAGNEQ